MQVRPILASPVDLVGASSDACCALWSTILIFVADEDRPLLQELGIDFSDIMRVTLACTKSHILIAQPSPFLLLL
jgi:hypothetical protein